MNKTVVRWSAVAALLLCPCAVRADDAVPASSPRVTPTVRLIKQCLPSVVAIRAFRPHEHPGVFSVGAGGGAVIHEAGYILTNDHVVRGAVRGEVVFHQGDVYAYRIVAQFPHEDLALLKMDSEHPRQVLPLGRSHDLMLGEPVLVVGTPGGLAHTASTGIVSGLNRSTATQDALLPWVFQTSAAVSGGSSGGPVINALGQQIGVVTARRNDAENINFAIAADRVREVLPRMIAAEQRFGFLLGMDVDMLAAEAKVVRVAEGLPAAKAGVRQGDVVRRAGNLAVRQGLDFHIALIDRQPGETFQLQLRRDGESVKAGLELTPLPLADPVADTDMAPGLEFSAYHGRWDKLPDFSSLEAVATGKADKPALAVHNAPGGENFGLDFTGYLKVPADGLYTFSTRSDDGSRLYVNDQLIVDNDGLHSAYESAGLVRLKAGLHAIRVTFFESHGQEHLSVHWEGPGSKKEEIPASAYFHRKADESETEPPATTEANRDQTE
jgi:S1-C subfamily serine protease